MNIKDFCVTKNQSLKSVMQLIDTTGFGVAFVIENEKLIGVVTDSDIRRSLLKGESLESSIETIMNPTPITLTEEEYKNKTFSLEKFPLYGILQIPIIDKNQKIKDIILMTKKEIIGRLFNGKQRPIKTILIVGGAGYLGSVLSDKLLRKGYKVKVLDSLIYGDDGIKHVFHHHNFEFIFGDMRDIKMLVRAIKGVDAVVHLAAIVGDQACKLNPEETIESNYLATKLFAEVCKYSQINRFVFASTCSVYGVAEPGKMLTEESELNPISLYAKMKLKSEQGLLELEDDNFSPTILRLGTLHGISYRMRFDLVVNILTIKALKEKEFKIFGGNQWRALCHVEDAADAFMKCLEKPIKEVKGQVFNIVTENLQIKDIGDIVQRLVPDAKKIVEVDSEDIRNYKVSSEKANNQLKFKNDVSVDDSVVEIKYAVVNKDKYDDYKNQKYSNYEFLKGKE